MGQLGLCINANGAVPDAAEYAALGAGPGDWVRTAVQGSLDLLDNVLATLPDGVSVMVSINNECREVKFDWSGWENACQIIADGYAHRVKIVGCGNELDLWHLQPPIGKPDPRLTPAFAASLVKRAAPILRPAGIKVAMSSVASGSWYDYLAEMTVLCGGSADLADLHLYVKRLNGVPNNSDWQSAQDALNQAADVTWLPVISSEAGIKIDDAGGPERQAQWVDGLSSLQAELVCSWCWHDAMASPGEIGGQAFGARGLDGQRKPSWFALQRLFGGPINHPPPEHHAEYVLGFRKWWEREPGLLGAALKNERNVAPEWQIQPTENGVLSWVGGKGHAFVTHEGRVFRWTEDSPASWEVPE